MVKKSLGPGYFIVVQIHKIVLRKEQIGYKSCLMSDPLLCHVKGVWDYINGGGGGEKLGGG